MTRHASRAPGPGLRASGSPAASRRTRARRALPLLAAGALAALLRPASGWRCRCSPSASSPRRSSATRSARSRRIPSAVVAPADGKVIEVGECELPDGEQGAPHRHLPLGLRRAREPRAGGGAGGRDGAQRDASSSPRSTRPRRRATSSSPSTSRRRAGARVRVVQITGLIARRIVCHAREGEWLDARRALRADPLRLAHRRACCRAGAEAARRGRRPRARRQPAWWRGSRRARRERARRAPRCAGAATGRAGRPPAPAPPRRRAAPPAQLDAPAARTSSPPANLAAGFYAIVQAMDGDCDRAALAIVVCRRLRQPRRPPRAPRRRHQPLRRRVRLDRRRRLLRRRARDHRLHRRRAPRSSAGPAGCWPSCTRRARRSASRASTSARRAGTGASRACRARPRPAWWRRASGSRLPARERPPARTSRGDRRASAPRRSGC